MILIDLVGCRFGRWTVTGRASDTSPVMWHVTCECGNSGTVRGDNLRRGVSRSCGCWKVERARAQATATPNYRALHSRISRRLGKATDHTCPCGDTGRVWAYDHTDPHPLHGIVPDGMGRPITVDYSTDITRYRALCWVCGRHSDLAAKWAVGQPRPQWTHTV